MLTEESLIIMQQQSHTSPLHMHSIDRQLLVTRHNRTRDDLSCYLPVNSALLIAVAMMACGWQASLEQYAPGFPQDGSWTVHWEGLYPLL